MALTLGTLGSTSLPLECLALPKCPHRPGTGTTPEAAVLGKAKAASPDVIRAEDWPDNIPYRYGWSLFEAGFYWEAHEVWESVWRASRPNSVERLFLKMAIQMSNACLKRAMGKDKATRRLTLEISRLLEELKAVLGGGERSYMGVDLKFFEQ
ncbi:DUF309 domain-containing protein [Pelagibius sp. Alg239-R121]|uniref:DUF309 domain-containing protein n=1 Tax=Pelagibius sp. Alg239-R121 TaxID=2993448 RepID=UPI0024A64897|nr:DUF309 domain-containing protein [Pelagibius sp. Alg239-R121]